MMYRMGASVMVVMVVGMGGAARAQAPRYRLVKVFEPAHDDYRAQGSALNDLGVAVANIPAVDSQRDQYGAVWDSRGKTRLFGPGGVNGSEVNAINNNGVLAGQSFNFDNIEGRSPPLLPILWDHEVPRVLPLPEGFQIGAATALNELGDAVGVVIDPQGNRRYVLWNASGVTMLPQELMASDLNGRGQIAGCKLAPNGFDLLPVIYENGAIRSLPLPSPSAVGCVSQINESGAAIATMSSRITLWQSNGSFLTLAPPLMNTSARAFNNRGEVIGFASTTTFGYGGLIYRPSSGSAIWDLRSIIDLTPEEEQTFDRGLRTVYAINNKGEILAALGRCCNDRAGSLPDMVLLAPVVPSGADSQPPVVSITAPVTGSYLTDVAVLQATASDNVGVAGVQFFVNGQPAGPEITTPPYRYEYDLVPLANNAVNALWATARDAAGNKTTTNIKSFVAQKSCVTMARGQVATSYIGSQTATFTITWTASSSGAPANSGFGGTINHGFDYRASAAAVAFAPDGQLEARNETTFVPSGVAYGANTNYRFRMVVDMASKKYSVWYRLLNQPEQQLAADLTTASPYTSVDFWVASTDSQSPAASQTVCDVKAKAGP